jgi:hypothetical protein
MHYVSTNSENLTERISVRFTPKEVEKLRAIAEKMKERRTSSMLRRLVLQWIDKNVS